MSVRAMTWALDQKVGDHTLKLILIALADFADEKGHCFPPQKMLAEIAECSIDTVQRGLKKLEGIGALSRQRRHNKTGNRSTDLYELSLGALSRNLRCRPKPQSAAKPKPHIDAVLTKPHMAAVASRTTSSEPPTVKVGLVDRLKPTTADGASLQQEAAALSKQTSVPANQELAKLNGCASVMLAQFASWESPSLPETQIATAIATQVRVYGPQVVRDAFAQISGDMPSGTIRSPLKVFPRICRRIAQDERDDATFGQERKPYPGFIGRGG